MEKPDLEMNAKLRHRLPTILVVTICMAAWPIAGNEARAQPRYTTEGPDIIDTRTGERVLLRGFGIGGWLLPEGYMWGLRTLNRPRQFEEAIVDLIGEEDADTFWRLYHENFTTEADFKAMRAFGANSIRIALLASKLQPREDQPAEPPFVYSEEGFRFLDSVMVWAARHDLGIIWDMHGAPGAQNAENISDSDGEARLWTEPDRYWPLLTDLWYRIAVRYAGNEHVIGYDLLNEPLLRRYDGIDPAMLRRLYVHLTDTIRTVDPHGLIFVEGDDWAQNFDMLEPLDWDPHLVLAFHSYPPTSNAGQLARWDSLRVKYDIPLWHGETGEQQEPYTVNRRSTTFLEEANVGWNWWTHKKLSRTSQPWFCAPTEGFQQILDYWQGRGGLPFRDQAREWLFEQAERTNTRYCQFLPDMVRSLVPFSPEPYLNELEPEQPEVFLHPRDAAAEVGGVGVFRLGATGWPLYFQWYRDGMLLEGETEASLRIVPASLAEDGAVLTARAWNALGADTTRPAMLHVTPFSGPGIRQATKEPRIDGVQDAAWENAAWIELGNIALGSHTDSVDISASFKAIWDEQNLYLLVDVTDGVLRNTDGRSHHNDGIEVYLDADNDKPGSYGDTEFQLMLIRQHEAFMDQKRGVPVPPAMRYAQKERKGGYTAEFSFPWSAVGGVGLADSFLGLDVHVNDNDDDRRENKITWWGKRDVAYRSPALFGTVRLVGE